MAIRSPSVRFCRNCDKLSCRRCAIHQTSCGLSLWWNAAAAAAAAVVDAYWDKGVGQYRDARGEIVTKHNASVSGARNAQILSDTASISEVGGA